MRKIGIVLLCFLCVVLFYFTFQSAEKVFRSNWEMPEHAIEPVNQHRVVLITKNLDTPFWDQVAQGAREQAQKEGVGLEIWGSYGNNREDFLEKIEIAIYSKVDGIIVQGINSDEFNELTKIKASFYNIPIITVANDVPIEESLRRTYVGSDQYLAGQMIAEQLLFDMGTEGEVVLMSDSHQEYYQKQRLQGIADVLKDYPNIQTVNAETPDSREQIISTTQDILNKVPGADAFIAVNADFTGVMVQEIGKRFQIEPYFIYSFDDGSDSLPLLEQQKLDGVIGQSPKTMGNVSVGLIIKWLNDEVVPLDKKGYLTDIRMLKAKEAR
ncbi:substrate-binding domain-containing protein [Planomicrobium sp. CPCC 101079]|uniref:sugar ABC transporter substrate-binding protein n=1 Tax=Planomicrobium sp. CPCC 101079 TaxID=2599618 RepID=UPI0011B47AC0|nr:substrate-binding domain-containing protein [Planomicrobium sp. CPCC 101079]TWT01424.1 sugar ABC transporter substrate-binding protein [Planomicrobium sp. CPCC 101079]